MTDEERLAEILRMTERYRADEDRRRVRMVEQPQNAGNAAAIPETPWSSPDLDEYAYTGSPSLPVTSQEAQFRPKLSTEQGQGPYPPLQAGPWLDARTAPQVPAGYTYGDDQVTRDPNNIPAMVQYPSPAAIAWDALTGLTPGIGSAVVGGVKGAGTAGKYAEKILDMVKDYRNSVGRHVRQMQEPPDQSVPEVRNSHGGSLVSGAIEGLRDMYTHPGKVWRGEADPYDPQQAFNFATTMMTGGVGGVPAKAGEAALGSSPTWYHPIARNKLDRPLEEMSATRVPTTEMAPRKIIEPEKVQGRVLTTLPGDRTAAGFNLTAVNERPLAHEVQLQGGPEYMLANKALWASQQGAANIFQDRINALAQQYGQKPLATFTAMGQRGGDYAHMNTDTVLGMLPSSKVLKKDKVAFDEAMRDRGFTDFVGLADPKKRDALREQMLNRDSGNLRKAFLEEMAAKPWQEKGFPDVGSARFATTNPDILHDPHLSSGYMIGETAPGRPTVNDPAQHLTYTTQIPGKAIGGFERAIPIDVMYPDWYKTRPKGEASPHTQRAIITQGPHQVADQRWVDRVTEYLRRERERDR